ncbi:unnamed protein product [Ilex paraguariensis]|uniref:Homeobox-leucine zipper protein n=1 Tax=Ilex paraguariensis TaxID=185542 RepID=A0ABC8T817_9AQUA
MEWNHWNGNLKPLVPRPDNSFGFVYNSKYDQYPEMKLPVQTQSAVLPVMDTNNYGNEEKKKRLTSDQLESLESSFQEDMKLDQDRKMKLAKELGLQPRQISVWFQNRRARWKTKQLERLYDAVKLELDVVHKEKQELQEEVMALRAILREQATKKPRSAGFTDISGEGTAESTAVATHGSGKQRGTSGHQIAQYNYVFNVDDYNPVMSPYWGVSPSYPSEGPPAKLFMHGPISVSEVWPQTSNHALPKDWE